MERHTEDIKTTMTKNNEDKRHIIKVKIKKESKIKSDSYMYVSENPNAKNVHCVWSFALEFIRCLRYVLVINPSTTTILCNSDHSVQSVRPRDKEIRVLMSKKRVAVQYKTYRRPQISNIGIRSVVLSSVSVRAEKSYRVLSMFSSDL